MKPPKDLNLTHGQSLTWQCGWDAAKAYIKNIHEDRAQWQDVAMNVSKERDNLLKIMAQALPILDAYRRASGGDGDVSAANFRAALSKHEGQ